MINDADFDKWNKLKKTLHNNGRVSYFRERQIWWCSIGQNIGYEVYGKGKFFSRPVLIFKKLSADTFIGIPLTSRDKKGTWFVPFTHQLKKVNSMLHQIRIYDKKRLIDRFGEIDDADYKKISEGLARLLRL